MHLVAHRRGAERIEATLRDLVEAATELRAAARARADDVVALKDVLAVGGKDRVAIDQAVDLLRNLRQLRGRAVGLLESLSGLGAGRLLSDAPDLTRPATALTLALGAAAHALAPLAAAGEDSKVALIGGVSVGICEGFVVIADGAAREVLELLSLTATSVTSPSGTRRPRRLRAVTGKSPTTTTRDASGQTQELESLRRVSFAAHSAK